MITPAQYRAAAQAGLDAAATDEEKLSAEKALEVARVLACLERTVPTSRYEGSGYEFREALALRPPGARDCYEERYLSLYMQCPACYRYEVIEELRRSRDESPYIQFHRCVYVTVRWLEQQRADGNVVDAAGAVAQLATHWQEAGPLGHAFEGFYRAAAEKMVTGLAAAIARETAAYDRREWKVPVGDRLVAVTPDRVVLTPDGVVHVQRIRTGRETKSESNRPIYALLRLGAEAQYAGKPVVVETFYLGTGKVVEVPGDDDRAALEKYADAIARIESGVFEPSPDARVCPKCQCYFACRC